VRKFSLWAVCFLAPFLLGCGGAKDLIMGKWEAIEKEEATGVKPTMEFSKDTIKVGMGSATLEEKYKWVDGDNIEIEMTLPGGKQSFKMKTKVSVTRTELTLTDPAGKEKKFKKV